MKYKNKLLQKLINILNDDGDKYSNQYISIIIKDYYGVELKAKLGKFKYEKEGKLYFSNVNNTSSFTEIELLQSLIPYTNISISNMAIFLYSPVNLYIWKKDFDIYRDKYGRLIISNVSIDELDIL